MPRLTTVLLAAALTPPASLLLSAQVPRLLERVEVSRVVVDVHVLAGDGRPLRGLSAADLRLTVDGQPVPIESVRWITGAAAPSIDPHDGRMRAPAAPAGDDRPQARRVVLLVQQDFDASRMEGLLAMRRRAEALLGSLGPDNAVAVASFQSHLELWTDFTTDREALGAILGRAVLASGRPPDEAGPAPSGSLRAVFDRAAGRRAATMEQALLVLARALDGVPGPKALVLLGHGFGRIVSPAAWGALMVGFDDEYDRARRILSRARVTVYCLDLTQADAHTLEAGLVRIAEDTGGFYARTHVFPDRAFASLGEALTGHYEVTFETPRLPWGEHRIRIDLVGRQGVVRARRFYVG